MTMQNDKNRKWMKKQESKGLCIFCRNKALAHSRMCERHYLYSISTSALGNGSYVDDLLAMFHLQKGKCYLTGRKLVFGVNAGIDHVIPKSRDASLAGDIRNIRWIDKDVNKLKCHMTDKELYSLCKEILKNWSYDLDRVM